MIAPSAYRRRWLWSLVVSAALLAGLTLPSSAQDEVAQLSRDERRAVQAALARAGFYDGLIDGAFGARSAAALAAWAADADDGSLARLARDFDARWRAEGWDTVPVRGLAQHFVAPFGLMQPMRDPTADHAWLDPASGTAVSVHRESPSAMGARHDTVAYLARPGSEVYRLRRDSLWITAVDSGTGPEARRHYLRSQRVGGSFETVALRASSDDPGVMMLMAGSITSGPVPLPVVPAGSALAAAMAEMPAAAPVQRSRLVTAVAVNASDAVTAAAAVEGCGALRGPDGTALRAVTTDTVPDLVLLRGDAAGTGRVIALSTNGVPPPGLALRLGGLEPGGMALDLSARVVAARAGVFVAGDPGVLDTAQLTPERFAVNAAASAVQPGWIVTGPGRALTGIVLPALPGAPRRPHLALSGEAVLRLLIEAGGAGFEILHREEWR
ncbi:MAG TPA: peptidoglycan-binding domain-containing protein, partial [Paracoccaceae bacterium]|nr:peptidoglycan-binding domain-containing protein [Paracoccaceae bacterium]